MITTRLNPRGTGWQRRDSDGFTLHIDAPGDASLAFAAAVVRGMRARPRRLEPRFIYDAHGSVIYEQITELPEYYQTRTEDAILASCANALAEEVGHTTLVELGSGSSTKTRRILEAFREVHGDNQTYIPIDVSVTAVQNACVDLQQRYPGLDVEGVASTFHRGLSLVEPLHPKTVLFLGSTLGNFSPDNLDAFFRNLAAMLHEGDHFVLGIDLVKEPAVLEAAYADSKGLTEQFILNVFQRMNTELDAGLDLDAFCMRSFYDIDQRQVEMWAEVDRAQTLHVGPLATTFNIAKGERILVEVSRKFTVDQIRQEAQRFDLHVREVYQDPKQYFALVVFARGPAAVAGRIAQAENAPAPERPVAPATGTWCRIPAGEALLGEPPTAKMVDTVEVGTFPVTCSEFLAFVENGGYDDDAFWSEEGRRWRDLANVRAPLGWERGKDGRWRVQGIPLDYLEPVTGVCFYEATAYAAWSKARLPTEAEWEKAAAWDPEQARQRSWPWGDAPPDPRRCNAGGSLTGAAAVGSYPSSVSFYGLHQALGDIWEWVLGEEGPVLRGGSFQTALAELDCTLRRSASGVHRTPAIGIRLARTP
ncbi:MAG: L-histidine N(alpha)-methyltransferase [Myxococcota bacterium]